MRRWHITESRTEGDSVIVTRRHYYRLKFVRDFMTGRIVVKKLGNGEGPVTVTRDDG